jgi:hypothetical protein
VRDAAGRRCGPERREEEIAVEGAAGRAEYVRCQKTIAARAAPLRAALLARCDLLLQVAGCR